MVNKDLEDVDRWGQLVKVSKVEEPSYGDFEELKILNSTKVHHKKVEDPNIDIYVKESEEILSCYYVTRNPTTSPIEIEKVLYV